MSRDGGVAPRHLFWVCKIPRKVENFLRLNKYPPILRRTQTYPVTDLTRHVERRHVSTKVDPVGRNPKCLGGSRDVSLPLPLDRVSLLDDRDPDGPSSQPLYSSFPQFGL